jgi:hypothetical protein
VSSEISGILKILSSVTLGTNMSTGISGILCHQEYQEYYVIGNMKNIMSSGISRILCHQEYQEYYVISNIWNKCQQETGILCHQEHQEYIMSSGISRIFMSSGI